MLSWFPTAGYTVTLGPRCLHGRYEEESITGLGELQAADERTDRSDVNTS